MKIFNSLYNYLYYTNNLGDAISSNENSLQDKFSDANYENDAVREIKFKDDNDIEINSNGKAFDGYFEFENQLKFDFNKYQKIELFFMVFDNTKLAIQNYADNYSELNKIFNDGKPTVDGILYLGRDSHNKREIQNALHSDSLGMITKKCANNCPRIYEHCTFPWYIEENYFIITMYDEITKSFTSQICYDYDSIILEEKYFDTYEKLRIDMHHFKLNGPIKGLNIQSVQQKKISLVAGFRLTKQDSDVKEIYFTKTPLIFRSTSSVDYSPINGLSLEDETLNNLNQDRCIEDQDSIETTNSFKQETTSKLSVEYGSDQDYKIENSIQKKRKIIYDLEIVINLILRENIKQIVKIQNKSLTM